MSRKASEQSDRRYNISPLMSQQRLNRAQSVVKVILLYYNIGGDR